MAKGSTAKRRWMIGCLTATGVLLLVAVGLLIAFFRFMDALNKVPPESTQIVLYNDTDERLRIDSVLLGSELVYKEKIILDVYDKKKYNYSASLFTKMPQMTSKLTILYTGLSTGQQWQIEGDALRVPDRPCKFVALLRAGSGEISSCRYNELQDFEHD